MHLVSYNIVHRIETFNEPPCTSKVRPLPADKLEYCEKLFKQMEELGVISRVSANSNTNWSSALHIVCKPNQKPRPVGDYRKLNEKVIVDSYPLPQIRNISQKLFGAKYFTKIDLKSAYWNIPLFEGHKHKTTLVTPFGAFYFNRLPFGIASAGPWNQYLKTYQDFIFTWMTYFYIQKRRKSIYK